MTKRFSPGASPQEKKRARATVDAVKKRIDEGAERLLLPPALGGAGVSTPTAVFTAVGAGVGVLYSVTTISGPPLAVALSNQGFVKQEFRAGLGVVRVVESTLTAASYYFLGLFTVESLQLLPLIVPSVAMTARAVNVRVGRPGLPMEGCSKRR